MALLAKLNSKLIKYTKFASPIAKLIDDKLYHLAKIRIAIRQRKKLINSTTLQKLWTLAKSDKHF